MKDLQFKVPGKWILAGEHAVVRGGQALVFPLPTRSLSINATAIGSAKLNLEVESADAQLRDAAFACWNMAIQTLKLPALNIRLKLKSDIPVGSGLGSSAALSVAITKVLSAWGFLPESQAFDFAHDLENLFHGQSSGLDIAAVLSNAPTLFERGRAPKQLTPRWCPRFFLMDSGLRSSTKVCVEQVIALQRPDIDERMRLAVRLATFALENQDEAEGQKTLREALVLAQSCFWDWKLVPEALAQQMDELRKRSILPLKITGSGAGGFLLCASTGPSPSDAIPCA